MYCWLTVTISLAVLALSEIKEKSLYLYLNTSIKLLGMLVYTDICLPNSYAV